MKYAIIAAGWLLSAFISFVLVEVLTEGSISDDDVARNSVMCLSFAPVMLCVSLVWAVAVLFYKLCLKLSYKLNK